MDKDQFSSNLAKAKGLGSAHEGTEHFIQQRYTALALIPLVIWFCFAIAMLPTIDYESLRNWVSFPVNSILLMIILIVSFYHLQLGLQVIIEDYISTFWIKLSSIILMKFVCFTLCIIGLFSTLMIAFT